MPPSLIRLLLASLRLALVSIAVCAGVAVSALVGWMLGGWVGVLFAWLYLAFWVLSFVTPEPPPEVGWSRGLCGVLQR